MRRCTVLIDGSPRRSCITPVGAVGQKQITTIEGLAQGDHLHPLQEAFLRRQRFAMRLVYIWNDHDGCCSTVHPDNFLHFQLM